VWEATGLLWQVQRLQQQELLTEVEEAAAVQHHFKQQAQAAPVSSS
jgi:hypothetical protein